jgi:hypothetical protein
MDGSYRNVLVEVNDECNIAYDHEILNLKDVDPATREWVGTKTVAQWRVLREARTTT